MSVSPANRKILLVDDDPVILRGYGQRLRTEGYEIQTAADGYEALAAAGQRAWDLILLDLRLPYRNGIEVLRVLRNRKETEHTTIYVLAQPGDADFVDRALREGADGVIEKAKVAPRDVVTEVAAALDAGRRRRPAGPALPQATSQVPAAVGEIARRFRKEASISSSRPAAARSIGSIGGTTMSPGQSIGAMRPARSVGGGGDDSPTAAPAVPPTPAARSALPAAASATVAPAQGGPPFDVALSRMVGQSGPLAQSLGLPGDYSCPICTGALILRLAPDPQVEFGVKGHFYCPRCTT